MTPLTETKIAENYRAVRERLESACARSGRTASSVTLVAVVKYARLSWVRSLVALGVHDLGESRPQRLEERAPLLGDSVRWHLVGHLQRNKVRRILPLVTTIQSVDTLRLLDRIDNLSAELQLRPKLLLEVNVAGEEQKDGFAPQTLIEHWHDVLRCRNVAIQGLMTMAPLTDEPEEARTVFRRLRQLRDRLAAQSGPHTGLPELSMGMSRDFEIAIEEGATIVRVGSDLFAGLDEQAE